MITPDEITHETAQRIWAAVLDGQIRALAEFAGLDPDTAHAGIRQIMGLSIAQRRARLSGPGRRSYARSYARRTTGAHSQCIVEGCGKPLGPNNSTGLCGRHTHTPGLCGCRQCQRRAAS